MATDGATSRYPSIANSVFDESYEPLSTQSIEEPRYIGVKNPVDFACVRPPLPMPLSFQVAWELKCHEQRASDPISQTGPRPGG